MRRILIANGGAGSGNFGHAGIIGHQGGSASAALVAKYCKMLPKGHAGIKMVKSLPRFTQGNDVYATYGRHDERTGRIEISEQTPSDELEYTIAHEVAHDVMRDDLNKMSGHMHFETDLDKGTRKLVRSNTAPRRIKKLMDFGESVHKHGGLSEYGASYKSTDPKDLWGDNPQNVDENLAEAFAAYHGGGKLREEAVRRNPKAMKLAAEYFNMR